MLVTSFPGASAVTAFPASSPCATPRQIATFFGERDLDDLETDVAYTARYAAALRAIEQEHPEALIRDPLARVFAGEAALMKVKPDMDKHYADSQRNSHSHIAIRARAFDDMLAEEIRQRSDEDGASVQVVNLGAGMCTRAWRLNFVTPTTWYEVDRLDSIKLRRKILDRFCVQPLVHEYRMVPQDFSQPLETMSLQLKNWHFDPSGTTIVIMEGLLMYLTVPEIQNLAAELYELSSGPMCLILSALNQNFLKELQNPGVAKEREFPALGQVKDLFTSSWEGGTEQAFVEAGWTVDFIMSREMFAREFLHCEMLNYPFPDPETSTELFVVLRRPRVESLQSFFEAMLSTFACRTGLLCR
jgi:methyltransferase (TIGR00027 family)|mmetsp:Transcript_82229/g.129445  ORF Transcript_82229/g.129445 Transcript_82229/m.129445 type:complete len:359 (-) Transcript_82229:9-1085(-)